MNEKEAAERVAVGGAWLDKVAPKNWPSLVDLDELDMADSFNCVLGWVFNENPCGEVSGYGYAMSELMGGDLELVSQRGFNAYSPRSHEEDLRLLEWEWRGYIIARCFAESEAVPV